MTEAAIEIRHFSFQIGKKKILKDISLEVWKGDYLSIVGPNGAGKTTLLKCLNRILTGGEGTIRIAGKDLDDFSQRSLAKTIAYVPQAGARFFPYTVKEFILMARYSYFSPFSPACEKDKEVVDQALDLTGMKAFAEQHLPTLSGGERQKVLIAAALAQKAKILLLDEPAAFLDPCHQADIFEIFRRINFETGVTILSVTHDLNTAVLASKRIVALKEGAVVGCMAGSDIMDNRTLRTIYGKNFLFVEHPKNGIRLVVPEGAP